MLEFLTESHHIGLFVLRAALGTIFALHGWNILSDMPKAAKYFNKIGFRASGFWSTVVGIVQFFGGLSILFGFATSIWALLIAIGLLVSIALKLDKGFIGGWEHDLMYLAAALAIAILGPGALILYT